MSARIVTIDFRKRKGVLTMAMRRVPLSDEALEDIRNNALDVAASVEVNTEKTLAATQVVLLAELIFEIRALREQMRES